MALFIVACFNLLRHLSDRRHGHAYPPLWLRGEWVGHSWSGWGHKGLPWILSLYICVLYIPTLWTVLTTHFMTSRSLKILKSSFPLPLVRAAEIKTSKTKWQTLKVCLMVALCRKQNVLSKDFSGCLSLHHWTCVWGPTRQKLYHCVNIFISLVNYMGACLTNRGYMLEH